MSNVSFRRTLQDESKLWEADGLLSPQQREAILRHYENQQQDSVKPEFPLYIRVVLTLAVLLVGLAVLLLISFNWNFLPGVAKLSIVGGVLAASHIGGLLLRFNGKKVLADTAFFFAGIMFGVGIWQVGQVFHLPADFPLGIWFWALGTFLIAMVLGSTPLHLLSAVLLAAWVISDVNVSRFVLFAAASLPVFVVLGIGSGIRQKKTIAAYSYVLVLLFWWILQGCVTTTSPYLPFHIAAVGLICITTSSLLKTCRFTDTVLERLGICLILGGLFPLSFLNAWGFIFYWSRPNPGDYFYYYVFQNLILSMLDFSILYVLFRFTNRNKNLREKFRNNKVVSVLAVSVLVLWFGSFFLSLLLGDHSYGNVYNRLQGDPLIIGGMLAVNILLVMTAIWLMWTGLQRERSDCFWGGVLFFLFWTVVRYVDLFSGFGGMLGAAAVFLVCGLFMFGISYVWAIQTRKRAAENTVEVFETPSQPFQIPVWLSKSEDLLSRFWQSERNVLTAYILVVLIQFGILGAMVANEMVPHRSGTTICVATVPVDPRDMFRGDYVTLRYPFSDSTDISGYAVIRNNPTEQTVFVSMQQDGELWKPTGISKSRPKDGVFLRGTVKPYSRAVIYGIESYFVQEGTGKEIENAMRRASGTVVVELNVAPNGKAAVKTVRIK